MAADASGWMPSVKHQPTQAWGYPDIAEDAMYPRAIVNHVAQGYFHYLEAMMAQPAPGKSYHFAVSRLGEITQFVSIWDPAWHAGDVNAPTWRGYSGGNPNKATIGIEQEGFSIPAPGLDYAYGTHTPWPEEMVEAIIRIHRFVFDSCANWIGVPSEDNVITHSMLNSKTRAQDPGDYWRATVLPRIIAALSAPPAASSPETRAVAVLDLDGARADIRTALVKLGG